MANWLTTARQTLLAALQADATLAAAVRTWFDWGTGLRRRVDLLPANCPLVSVVAAELDEDELSNMASGWAQDIEIGIATEGQDLEPCEELVAAALDVVLAQNQLCLGLAASGVSGLSIISIRWHPEQKQGDPRVVWLCMIVVRIHWLRTL